MVSFPFALRKVRTTEQMSKEETIWTRPRKRRHKQKRHLMTLINREWMFDLAWVVGVVFGEFFVRVT